MASRESERRKQWGISAATIRSWEEKKRIPIGLYLARITRILARLEAKEKQKGS